jgi:hypothetical protein
MSPKGDQPAAGSRPIGVGVVTGRGDRDGNNSKEVAMRPIRTIAPLALGLVALAVAGCQSRPDQSTAPVPAPIERAAPAPTPPAVQARPPATAAPKPKPVPGSETVVGRWPARTLGYARMLQNGADAGHRPWLLSPEQVALAFARAEMDFLDPVTRRIAPATYDVGQRNSEWAATLHLAQPVRQGAGGIWVVTRIASPEGSY